MKSKIDTALEERNEQDYQAFCLLKELIRAVDWDNGKQRFIAIINEFNGDNEGGEDSIGANIFNEAQEIINEREAANERFLQAIKDAARNGYMEPVVVDKTEEVSK